jgi:hypothetical protein
VARVAIRTAVAAGALVVLLAALGAGSASATRLCKVPGEGAMCILAGDRYPANTPVKLVQLGKSKFEIGITNVECSASTLEGETTNAGGAGEEAPVTVKFTKRSFTGCVDSKGKACQTKVLRAQWNGGFYGTGNVDGALLFDNEFEFICGTESCIDEVFVVNEGFVRGGILAKVEVKLEELTLVAGAKNCAQHPKWTAIYEVSTPAPLFVTEN